mgnify:CR=1 FL=1
MARWFKKKEQSTLPQEVQDYYTSTQRQRMGMAWLVALTTFVITLSVALALFFVGRAIFYSLTRDDGEPVQITEQVIRDEPVTNVHDTSEESSVNNTDTTREAPTTQTNDRNETPGQSEQTPVSDQPSQPARTEQPPSMSEQTLDTQKVQRVPDSGPGDVVALFVVVSIVSAAFHYGWRTRHNSR